MADQSGFFDLRISVFSLLSSDRDRNMSLHILDKAIDLVIVNRINIRVERSVSRLPEAPCFDPATSSASLGSRKCCFE